MSLTKWKALKDTPFECEAKRSANTSAQFAYDQTRKIDSWIPTFYSQICNFSVRLVCVTRAANGDQHGAGAVWKEAIVSYGERGYATNIYYTIMRALDGRCLEIRRSKSYPQMPWICGADQEQPSIFKFEFKPASDGAESAHKCTISVVYSGVNPAWYRLSTRFLWCMPPVNIALLVMCCFSPCCCSSDPSEVEKAKQRILNALLYASMQNAEGTKFDQTTITPVLESAPHYVEPPSYPNADPLLNTVVSDVGASEQVFCPKCGQPGGAGEFCRNDGTLLHKAG